MDSGGADALAAETLRALGFAADDPPVPAELVEAKLGPAGLRILARKLVGGHSGFAQTRSGPRIYVASDLSPQRRAFQALFRLARIVLAEKRMPVTDANAEPLAAALAAPSEAFLRMWQETGGDVEELARYFVAEPELIHLRRAETMGDPARLVTPERVRVRGRLDGLPVDEETCRQWARADILPRHVRRVPVGPGRVVLLAA